ncbi:MAG: hypothetical protein ACI9Y1_003463 [Lentisphaeria bacterium]|jgi:hypothetical protein
MQTYPIEEKEMAMKIHYLSLTAILSCLSTLSSAETPNSEAATNIYLNENLGFNVEGYKYAQSEYPCDIDRVLVEKIIQHGKSNGLNIEAVGTADKIHNASIPVLAIDIETLVLGEERKRKYGADRIRSNLPSVRVTAAIFDKSLKGGLVSAKHSCAIASLKEFNSSSNILDMGTYGVTVCSATHKCLNDLSSDIVRWTTSQVAP